jgi:hypothetical protein
VDTTKVASVSVGIAFVIGVLYNFGYFASLDLNFFTFLSYKDHLTVLVFFAAPCLVMALLFGAYRRKMPKLDQAAAFLAVISIAIWAGRVETAGLPSVNAFFFWFRGISSLFLIPYLSAVSERGGHLHLIKADGPLNQTAVYDIIARNVDKTVDVIMTDESALYNFTTTAHHKAKHKSVNHRAEEYARYEGGLCVTTNAIESAFSLFNHEGCLSSVRND